jgi:hypothetical protein
MDTLRRLKIRSDPVELLRREEDRSLQRFDGDYAASFEWILRS